MIYLVLLYVGRYFPDRGEFQWKLVPVGSQLLRQSNDFLLPQPLHPHPRAGDSLKCIVPMILCIISKRAALCAGFC